MNQSQHTSLIESLGWLWTGPWTFHSGYNRPPHYAISRVPQTDAVPDEVMVNALQLAGWRIIRAPFPGHLGHTYLWAYPPTT